MTREFSHLDETGGISMVDVGRKRATVREAVAVATVRMQPATLRKLVERALPKGDVLTTAKVAGVLAAKQTPNFIPLSHNIAIDSVDVTFDLDPNGALQNLAKDDFQLYVNGKSQPIDYFDPINFRTPAKSEAAPVPVVPRDIRDRRLFLLILDCAFTRPEALDRARRAAAAMIDAS